MKSVFFLLFFSSCFFKSFGQCSAIIAKIAVDWKADSLGNNGYRLAVYKELLSCKIDKVYRGLLLDKLGKPNEIQKTNHGEEYIYYYYDERKILPKEERTTFIRFVVFKFDEYNKYALSIEDGFFN